MCPRIIYNLLSTLFTRRERRPSRERKSASSIVFAAAENGSLVAAVAPLQRGRARAGACKRQVSCEQSASLLPSAAATAAAAFLSRLRLSLRLAATRARIAF